MTSRPQVVILGAGLAGLSCARRLARLGIPFVLLDASGHVGGRVATDLVDGFRLDRGFQVLLDSYPEVRRQIDLEALAVRSFRPGALVRCGGRFWSVVDPWRALVRGILTLRAPFVSPGDALRMASLRRTALRAGEPAPAGTAAEFLRAQGFSNEVIESFFRPFLGGSTLHPNLEVPASWFLSLFGHFARGRAVLPAEGMRALPEQLAAALPPGCLRLNSRVTSITHGALTLATGEILACDRVVVATDASSASSLLDLDEDPEWLGATTLYYAAANSPVGGPILVLNGEGPSDGPVNHLAVPSDVQPDYSPDGSALVAASVLGIPSVDDGWLDEDVRRQLVGWYGSEVRAWRLLRVDRVTRALPRRPRVAPPGARRPGVFVCGDYVSSPSIQGALESGRASADALSAALLADNAMA